MIDKIDWSIVSAIISKSKATKTFLAGRPEVKTKVEYLPMYFDIEEFGKAVKIITEAKTFGHIMGYGKYFRIGKTWDVFNSPMGTGEVIKAAKIAKTKVKIFAVSKSMYRPHLEKLAEEGDVEIIIKDFDSPADIINEADIFIQPSHEEGFGRTYFETLNCGRPTFTTNWPPMNEFCDIPELFIPVEKYIEREIGERKRKYLYVIPSAKVIAEKINWIKSIGSKEIEKLSMKIQAQTSAQFSFEVVKSKWDKFLEKELGGKE